MSKVLSTEWWSEYWKTWMEYKTENYETNNVWMKDTHVGAFGIWIIYMYDKII